MNEPVPPPLAGPSSGRIYSLTVVQQPVRARMCGFGDKDRRPISPPIIVKLTATDAATRREVGVDGIDPTFLILAADLRGSNGFDDANLVEQHRSLTSRPARTPSLRASSTTSTNSPSQHSQSLTHSPPPTMREANSPDTDHDSSSEDGETDAAPVPNLIGTLHTNAYKLRGLDGEKSVYFVLPDLSVRTEGAFRLRLRLVDLRQSISGSSSQSSAAVLTDEFQVFTAKRFTGMLDPTPLSQCFAKQGVRIPTRRAAKAKKAVEMGDKVKHEEG
ncbi:hypothetical protein JCM10296v2_000761 [Rhodotorula toruloides]